MLCTHASSIRTSLKVSVFITEAAKHNCKHTHKAGMLGGLGTPQAPKRPFIIVADNRHDDQSNSSVINS